MKRKRGRLVVGVAITVFAGGVVAAASYAASPALNARLFAKAGPVKMHADLTLTTAGPAAAKVSGSLSSCVVQPVSKPRSGVADRITCTTDSGANVTVPLAATAATLTYHLAAAGTVNLQSATVQIRHKTTVLATLTPAGGSVTVALDHTAGLINGHDAFYVQAGAHVYIGKIVQAH